MEDDVFKTITAPSEGSYRDKGSKFLAFAYPVSSDDEVKNHVQYLKKEYYDARHHCYAYRIGAKGESYRANDDGEPSGSAGRPILGQLLSNELTNVLVVVVRYFGGIKLGVPGLIFAYKEATNDAITNATIIEKTDDEIFNISFSYDVMNDVMKVIKDEQPNVINQQFDLTCHAQLSIRKLKSAQMRDKLAKIDTVVFNDN